MDEPATASVSVAGLMIELVEGDIIDQAGFAAVVNAANSELLPGGGVAGAIRACCGGLDLPAPAAGDAGALGSHVLIAATIRLTPSPVEQ